MADTPTFSALYRDRVLDHGRAPRHAGTLDEASHRASVHNALCGDRLTLRLRLDADGRIAALRHQSEGCLLCLASVSLMACDVPGRDAAGVAARLQALRAALAEGQDETSDHVVALGDLAALAGVAAHPARHRCVLLPWECLQQALAGGDDGAPA
ncbi:MAG TPA: SUF system NifU family Fe-S cluster assembly protein [Arenimonas sp.]|uniref:Fe-S cluster assembly sulfur transfer protein SufU n=1 Tax=Arenimonas sp. TaxID=1872635 RepID=UPI002D7F48C1|nr:SUF system NifU family Fe-S cluster assembly protein [Arenimonas sp.]HEU0152315.1 SUF system NifU family Fe-S cluster assembly protein [Arenimonas sp.]